MAASLGADNPFRYRGYYYDNETGLYYLNARYYNPGWGRFINADSYGGSTGQLLSHNVFAYCSNNPVMMSDPSGNRETIGAGDAQEESKLIKKEQDKRREAIRKAREDAYRILLWLKAYAIGNFCDIESMEDIYNAGCEMFVKQYTMDFLAKYVNSNINYFKDMGYNRSYVFICREESGRDLRQMIFVYNSNKGEATSMGFAFGGDLYLAGTAGTSIMIFDQYQRYMDGATGKLGWDVQGSGGYPGSPSGYNPYK